MENYRFTLFDSKKNTVVADKIYSNEDKTNIICLDYSEKALTVAKRNFEVMGNSGSFVKGDVRKLPFDDDSYDVIFSTGLLEHFKKPEIIVNGMVKNKAWWPFLLRYSTRKVFNFQIY